MEKEKNILIMEILNMKAIISMDSDMENVQNTIIMEQ